MHHGAAAGRCRWAPDDLQPLDEDKLRQEVEAYIKAHHARGQADKVYVNAPSKVLQHVRVTLSCGSCRSDQPNRSPPSHAIAYGQSNVLVLTRRLRRSRVVSKVRGRALRYATTRVRLLPRCFRDHSERRENRMRSW